MNSVLGHDSALYGYTLQGTTLINKVNFSVDKIQGVGSITGPVDQQSSMLQLCYGGCTLGRQVGQMYVYEKNVGFKKNEQIYAKTFES